MWLLVVLIVIAGIAWFVMGNKGLAPSAPGSYGTTASPSSPNAESIAPPTSSALPTSPTDDSNAALNEDLTSINNQLNGLASDSASIDQGLNDQPVTQGE
jgi:hypothetical protein